MKYQLKKPCPECPYARQMAGWIGSHETAKEFHDIAKEDEPFPCHMILSQACAGNALYMNRLCKLSRDPEKAEFQKGLEEPEVDILFSFDGSQLVKFHGK